MAVSRTSRRRRPSLNKWREPLGREWRTSRPQGATRGRRRARSLGPCSSFLSQRRPRRPRAQQQDAPPPPPAADQGPRADGLPQGEDAGGPGVDLQGTAPSRTGPAGGDPGQDVPGALIGGILLAGAFSAAPAGPAADCPAAGAPSPWGPPALPSSPRSPAPDYGDEPPSHPATDVEDDEGGRRVVAAALGEGEAEARAALAAEVAVLEAEHKAALAEELEVATQVAVPEEGVGDAAAGSHPTGAQPDSTGWLGGPDPDAGSPEQKERLPVRPGAYQGPVTPSEVYMGAKQEPKEGE